MRWKVIIRSNDHDCEGKKAHGVRQVDMCACVYMCAYGLHTRGKVGILRACWHRHTEQDDNEYDEERVSVKDGRRCVKRTHAGS